MKTHDLKTWQTPFVAIQNGSKTCEFRKNDRDFKVGDLLVLHWWDQHLKQFMGFAIPAWITHIVYGPDFGIPEGYCMMSIRKVDHD